MPKFFKNLFKRRTTHNIQSSESKRLIQEQTEKKQTPQKSQRKKVTAQEKEEIKEGLRQLGF